MDSSQTGELTVLLIQTAAAWFMAGLIWTMQILNYPRAAANAVILLIVVLLIAAAIFRLVDVRKELVR